MCKRDRSDFATLAPYGRDPAGDAHHLPRGLADPRVETIGGWPTPRVVVSFTHPIYPTGRLRRTLRVFDAAGRAIPALYASIHLMEDLDTKLPPDARAARAGILDF